MFGSDLTGLWSLGQTAAPVCGKGRLAMRVYGDCGVRGGRFLVAVRDSPEAGYHQEGNRSQKSLSFFCQSGPNFFS